MVHAPRHALQYDRNQCGAMRQRVYVVHQAAVLTISTARDNFTASRWRLPFPAPHGALTTLFLSVLSSPRIPHKLASPTSGALVSKLLKGPLALTSSIPLSPFRNQYTATAASAYQQLARNRPVP